MGAANNKSTDGQTGNEQPKTNRSNPASTSNSGRGRGRGRGTGTGTAATGNTKSAGQENLGLPNVEIKDPKVVAVEVPNEVKETKAKRGRPAGSTAAKKKTPAAKQVDATHFIVLLQTLSNVIGTREGMHMFMLTKEEATQIATPLANIMAKNDAIGEFAGEYADHIALLIAAAAIFVPKFLLYQHMKKQQIQPLHQPKGEPQHERSLTRNDASPTKQNRDSDDVQSYVQPLAGTINDVLSPIV